MRYRHAGPDSDGPSQDRQANSLPGRKRQFLPIAKVNFLQSAANGRREIVSYKVVEPARGIALEELAAGAKCLLLISFTPEILDYFSEGERKPNCLAIELNMLQSIKCSGSFQIVRDPGVALAVADIAGTKLKESDVSGHAGVGRDR